VIPQNTGSIARLCACIGATLHLIHPLGFSTDEAAVKRAGLDYWDFVDVKEYLNFEDFLKKNNPEHLYFFSKFSNKIYTQTSYQTPCYLVMGSETKGLPKEIHERYSEQLYKIPMRTEVVRSLNLAQAAAVVAYEALRQNT
jgi:tRNA (cytidine/uridine-2'-O-)-methyltransferase